PLNTNGGGLSYMHSGMYGMYALQESVRQMRGIAPAQVPDAKISVCHGVGGMFAASGTIIMSNEPPLGVDRHQSAAPAESAERVVPRVAWELCSSALARVRARKGSGSTL